MYPFKRSSRVLLIASIIGVITYFYLRDDQNAPEPQADKLTEPSTSTAEPSEQKPAVATADNEESPKADSAHGADCAHCQAKSSKAVPQLTTNPDADFVFKKLARTDDKLIPRGTFDFLRGSKVGQEVSFEIGELEFDGTVGLVREDHHLARSYGIYLDDELGRVRVVTDAGGALTAQLFFLGDSRVVQARSVRVEGKGEALHVEETTIDSVICAMPDTIATKSGYRSVSGQGALQMPNAVANSLENPFPEKTSPAPTGTLAIPALQSNPDSEYIMYLDFDGEVVTGTFWNFDSGVDPINAVPLSQASDDEWVNLVWRRVVEDYAPYTINVTTDVDAFNAQTDPTKKLHVIITSTKTVAPDAGGVAFVHSFRTVENICWSFNASEYMTTTTISHEAGHAFGLEHDGQAPFFEYYFGHNESYAPGWAPIMGAGFADGIYDEVDQWSIGEYSGATRSGQDDVAVIGDTEDPQGPPGGNVWFFYTDISNGFGFVPDDYGDTYDGPGVGSFEIIEENVIQASGLISTADDQDVFSFAAPDGNLRFVVTTLDVNSVYGELGSETSGSNLAPDIQLLNSNGQVIATGSETGSNLLTSFVETSVLAGTYYLVVDGGGRGTDPDTGFSDYASLGVYDVVGELDLPPLSVLGGDKQDIAIFNGSTTTDTVNGTDFGFSTPGGEVRNTFSMKNFGLSETIENIQISFAGGASSAFSLDEVTSDTDPIGPSLERFIDILYNPATIGADNDTVTITYEVGGEPEQFEFVVRGFATQALDKDNYEENDTGGTAYDLNAVEGVPLSSYQGPAFFLDDKHDYYTFTAEDEDDYIQIDVAYDSSAGNVRFELRNTFQTVAQTEAGRGRMQFIIPENYTGNQRKFYIYVTTTDNATVRNQYDLVWNAVEFIADGDDFYEENDTKEDAYDLTFAGSQLSQILGLGILNDEDWYRINVPSDPFVRMLYVAALFDEEQGNVDIEVYQENVLVGVSATGGNKEVVSYRETVLLEDYTTTFFPAGNTTVTGLSPGTYYVRVFGDFAGNNYDLIVDTLSDDRYEDGEGGLENDLQANAFDLGEEIVGKFLSEVDGIGVSAQYLSETADPFVNGSDDDWYKFSIPEGLDAEQITLDYQTDFGGQMVYAIYDAAGNELVRTQDGSTDPGILTLNNPLDTEYFIFVSPRSEIDFLSAYDFRVNVSEEPPIIENPQEDNYEENDDYREPFNISSNEGRYLSSLDGYGTHLDPDWFWFNVPSNASKLTTSLFFNNSDGDLDLTLSKRDGPKHFVSSNGTDVETITWDNPIPGNYALTVTGQNPTGEGSGNYYNLIWDITLSEDNYEENDTLGAAFDLTGFEDRFISKLNDVGIQADDDWFEIVAYEDTVRLTASISFTHNDGDIDLALYNASGALIRRSISTTDSETLNYNNPPAGTYYLRTYYGNEANEYNLYWAAITQDELDQIPDGDDLYEQNDTRESAFVLDDTQRRLTTVDGLGIQKDDDWYQFEVAEGNVGLRVEVLFDDSLGDIDFEVYDPLGFPLGVRDSITDNEIFVIESPVPVGTYLVRVFGTNIGNEYELYWNVFFEDIYEENDVDGEAYNITGLLGTPLSDTGVPTLSDDDWFVFTASADRPFILVELEHANIDGGVDFELLDSSLNVLARADSLDDFEFVLEEVEIGTFYVRVYGDNLYNTYDLTVSVIGDDIYEDNDISSQAADITGVTPIQAVQFDDDWYSFNVTAANSFLTVGASFAHENGNIDIAIYGSGDLVNPLDVSATTDDNDAVRVPGTPGTYFVRVFGDNTNPFYQLFWTVSPDDEYEQNDELEAATDITTQQNVEIEAIQFDEDWFKVSVEPGALRLLVDLLFLHDEGNLSLTLYDESGEELVVVDSDTDNEELRYSVYPFGTVDQIFYIKVDGDSIGTEYTLIWESSREDNFEGDTGNNTYFTASEDLLVSEGKKISDTIGYGGALNDDWYKVQINPGDQGIVIELFHQHSEETNIDIELFSAGQLFLKRSIGFSDVERIHYKGPPGTYYLRVFGSSGENPYDLFWNSYAEDNLEPGFSFWIGRDPPDNDTTASPRQLYGILPNLVRGSTDLEFVILDNLTLLDEDWYLFEVEEGEDICLIDLEFDHLGGDIDVALYYAGVADFFLTAPPFEDAVLIAQSESEEDRENIAVPNLEPGWYLICVYGYGITNPKTEPDWIPGAFDPFTDDFSALEENENPSFAYYELAEPNAQSLGNTYSMRWISTTDDIYDIKTEDPNDVEINDSRLTFAEPELRDQYDILDDDGIIDAEPRTRTEINSNGESVEFEYQPVYTYPGLSQLDEDWYAFTISTGIDHGFRAAIVYSVFQADLDLRIYNISGELLQASEGNSSIEFVEVTGSGLTTYFVQVVGEDLGTPYTLEVRGFRAEDNFDDLYEDNDSLEQAYDITDRVGIPITDLVKRDEDWFRVDLPRDQVHLFASAISLTELMGVEIYDADGNQLPLGYYQTRVISPEAATYYLRVIGGTSGSNYRLSWIYDNVDEYEGFFGNNTVGDVLFGFGEAILSRFRLEPVYDPQNIRYEPPIKEFAFDYGLLANLVFVNGILIDPFGHAIQESDDWYAIQIPSWFLATAKKGNQNIEVLKRIYNVRLNVEIEFAHVDGNIDMEIYDLNGITDLFAPDGGPDSIPLARSTTSNDIETLNVAIDPTSEDLYYLIRVFGDDAANDYSLKWDVTTVDAYEELEDELLANNTNNFVNQAFDLTHTNAVVDGEIVEVSTENTWLDYIEYLQDVNGDGVIDPDPSGADAGFASTRGFGNQTTDDWYAVVVSEGATDIEVHVHFYSDNDTGYEYAPDEIDFDFEVYFLAGNDGNDATTDLRKPVLVGRSTADTDDTSFVSDPFVSDGFESKQLPEDVTRELHEFKTFNIEDTGPGIYFIRIYYDNRIHPYTFYWDDIGDAVDADDSEIIEDYVNGNWSFDILAELPADQLVDPFANFDGDRFQNYAEFALGLDTSVADYAVIGQSIGEVDGELYYLFEFVRNVNAKGAGIKFTVQESDDLSFGTNEAEWVRTEPIPGRNDFERVTYRCSKPIDEQDKCFFRLMVNYTGSIKP